MARGTFGTQGGDYVADSNNRFLAGRTVTFWSAETGGTQYTDLLVDGAAASSVRSVTAGRFRVQGPDGIRVMWADEGDPGNRTLIMSAEAVVDNADLLPRADAAATYQAKVGEKAVTRGVGGELAASGAMYEEIFETKGNAAPFVLSIGGDNVYNGVQDDLFTWGYNRANVGSRKVQTEPGFGWQLEADVNDDGDDRPGITRAFEWNFDYAYADGTPGERFLAFRADRGDPKVYTRWSFTIGNAGTMGNFRVQTFAGTVPLQVSPDGDTTVLRDVLVGGKVRANTTGLAVSVGAEGTVEVDAAGVAGGRFKVGTEHVDASLPLWFGASGSAPTGDVALSRSAASTLGVGVGSAFLAIGANGTGIDLNSNAALRLFAGSGGITIRSDVGFHGGAPIAKRAATADATDLATVITLANALKADLVAYNLKTA